MKNVEWWWWWEGNEPQPRESTGMNLGIKNLKEEEVSEEYIQCVSFTLGLT